MYARFANFGVSGKAPSKTSMLLLYPGIFRVAFLMFCAHDMANIVKEAETKGFVYHERSKGGPCFGARVAVKSNVSRV